MRANKYDMKVITKKNDWLQRVIPGFDHVIEFGWGNGYVLLDEGHPLHSVPYDSIAVEIHGGLTYSKEICENDLLVYEQLASEDIGKWMIGFSTDHSDDTLAKWPEQAVLAEANRLKEQIELMS